MAGTEQTDAEKLGKFLNELDWYAITLARVMDCSPSTVYNWVHGKQRVPGSVFAYLELRVRLRNLIKSLGIEDERHG